MSDGERQPCAGAKVGIEAFSFFYPGGQAALRDITLAIACNSIVFPDRGGETISPLCPNPMGFKRSMILME